MRKIKNAFALRNSDYCCFGCAPDNVAGLHMEFFRDGEEFWSEWQPKEQFDGWKGVVHGGIQVTLMDEISGWFLFSKYGRSAVTMEICSKFIKPLSSVDGKIIIRAKEISFNRNIAEVEAQIYNNSNQLCTESTGKFYVFSEKESKEKFDFPDLSEF